MLKPFRGPSKGEGSGFLTPDPTLPTPPPAKSCQNKSGWCAPGPGLQAFLHRTMQLVFPRNLQTIRWQHGKLLKGHNSHTCQNRAWGRLAAWYNNKRRSRTSGGWQKSKIRFCPVSLEWAAFTKLLSDMGKSYPYWEGVDIPRYFQPLHYATRNALLRNPRYYILLQYQKNAVRCNTT